MADYSCHHRPDRRPMFFAFGLHSPAVVISHYKPIVKNVLARPIGGLL